MIVLLKEGYYMRKLFAFLALFAVVLTLSACTTKVAGKTFVYEELEISFTEKGDENTNAKIQQYLEALYTGKEITFNEDGTCTGGTYTQDGSEVVVNETLTYEAKGGKLVYNLDIATLDIDLGIIKIKLSDYATSVKLTYKVKK